MPKYKITHKWPENMDDVENSVFELERYISTIFYFAESNIEDFGEPSTSTMYTTYTIECTCLEATYIGLSFKGTSVKLV